MTESHMAGGHLPQRIAVSGAGGLVGSALCTALQQRGDVTIPLSRSAVHGTPAAIAWDPETGVRDPTQLSGLNAVVHLAGENIASGRWNERIKAAIRDSRIQGTRGLVRSLADCPAPPTTLICASAIGYYGDRGDEPLTEDSAAGSGFLADVCREWETEALAATGLGMRVVCLRIGVVLSRRGGALAKMLTPFRLGLGGIVGSGRQYWSWIGLEDLVGALLFCLDHDTMRGPVNAVSPAAVTNREFTRTLGAVLHRPTVIPMPAFAARLVLGEMAEALLLASTRVEPGRLTAAGYSFKAPDLLTCLKRELE